MKKRCTFVKRGNTDTFCMQMKMFSLPRNIGCINDKEGTH